MGKKLLKKLQIPRMKGGYLDLETSLLIKEDLQAWGFYKMAPSCQTALHQKMIQVQGPVDLKNQDHPALVMEDRLSNLAEDQEHQIQISQRPMVKLIGERILNFTGSEGVAEPGKKLAVEVVKIAAQRKRRKGENQIIVQRKRRVKSQIG